MPTATDTARAEQSIWIGISEHWTAAAASEVWAVRPPTERAVIVFHDPGEDLARRARDWSYDLPGADLASLAVFAAGLAGAEAEGWEADQPDLATRAYEARRFLLADRVIHWAVPWLEAVSRGYPAHREVAHADRDLLLGLADEARVAPALPGTEGLLIDEEDSFGPVEPTVELPRWVGSLWSGMVCLDQALPLAARYEEAAMTWRELAVSHPGSAQLWSDLSRRAEATAALL